MKKLDLKEYIRNGNELFINRENWQKINVISIKSMGNSQYSKKSISIPTPFSFYTGDHGKIENGNKSWID